MVCDTGIGISEEDKKSLFSPFFQSDLTNTKRYRGAGLGLSITQKLVEAMGGTIRVESELNLGTIVTLTMNLNCEEESMVGDITLLNKDGDSDATSDATFLLENARILLVEDNYINKHLAIKMLKKIGVKHVDTADDGYQALVKVVQNKYDLVLMDIQMPIMDGYKATETIRRIFPDLPIIAMTANAMKADIATSLRYGMNDHISKPINLEYMKDVLKKWLTPTYTD